MTIFKNSSFKALLIVSVLGAATGGSITRFLLDNTSTNVHTNLANKEKSNEPLYWVAPMDANYQRDKPGKSPMGMDLVPVYADDGNGPDEGAGTIRISSNVINNLGVRTVSAQYLTLDTKINTVGYVSYDEDKLVHIHPRVQGWIEKLYVKAIGDPVKKGQALYDIYSPELVNAQEELILALERKNKRLISAAQDRLHALQLPKSTIENLKKERKVKQFITFFAPQNGVVKRLDIREGFYVKPETMMLSIADLSQVWVKAEVFERQAAQVSMGDNVVMKLDYLPNKQWQGEIEHIHPMINAINRTAIVRLRFDNANGELKPNMFAQITIHTSADQSALLIPKEALIRTGTQDRVVLALGEGNFKSIEVSVGRFGSKYVEILSGLSEGERVVSSAQFLLDSESSKSSDFKRMNQDDAADDQSSPSSVWVQAQIQSLMAGHKMLTLKHAAIPEWDWPEMTMDFIATESVDFSQLSVGISLQVEVSKTSNGDYQVSNIHIPDVSTVDKDRSSEMNMRQDSHSKASTEFATVTGTINSLMVDHGMINISRSAIEKWNRPAAMVDFISDSSVSLVGFKQGMKVKFTFEIREGDFIITDINQQINTEQVTNSSDSEDVIVDHSNH